MIWFIIIANLFKEQLLVLEEEKRLSGIREVLVLLPETGTAASNIEGFGWFWSEVAKTVEFLPTPIRFDHRRKTQNTARRGQLIAYSDSQPDKQGTVPGGFGNAP